MKSLRIIVLMPVAPLPFSNAVARWFYVLVCGLVARGHRVTVFTVCKDAQEIAKVNETFVKPDYDIRCYQIPQQERTGLLSKLKTINRPYAYVFSPELKQDLESEIAKSCDILHCEDLFSGWLGLAYRDRTIVNVHYSYAIDRSFEGSNFIENKLRQFMTNRAERKLLQAFPNITTLSDRLAQYIRSISPQASIYTVPLGIDLSLYPFPAQQHFNQQPIVGLIGGFQWRPSYSAAERLIVRLWPKIRQRVPNARLQIIGRNADTALAQFANTEGLELYPDVPDTLPYFYNLDVMLYAPVAGSGMKVKVMEAFALGTPVVTTSDGVEGLAACDRIHAGICEEDRDLIDRTVELLTDRLLSSQLRLNARQLLEKYCSPEVTVSQIEEIYTQIINP
jgi:polysaccharide biosynthesis protein PslH